MKKRIGHIGAGKALTALVLAGAIASPTPITAQQQTNETAITQSVKIKEEKKEIKAVPNKKKHLHLNRFLAPKPFIVRNQRQKRKRWRQVPQRRPK